MRRLSRLNPHVFLQVDGTPVETYDLDTTPLVAADVGAYTMAEVDAAIAAAVTPGALTVKDSNGFSVITTGAVASAVNQLQAFGSAAGGGPSLYCVGADSNIGLTIGTKGAGTISIYVPAGQTPRIGAAGPDTNLDFNITSKGTGVPKANGVEIVTLTGIQTLTNKTLTSPKVGTSVLDTNGNILLALTATANAANYVTLSNAAAGSGYPALTLNGSDTNIHVGLIPKGTGQVKVYSGSNVPAIGADGPSANIDLYAIPKGTGALKVYVASGLTPTVKADGNDTNHDLKLQAKGTGVLIADAIMRLSNVTAPAGTPSTSGYLYVESGALKYKGSGGTVTTLAAA